MKKEDLLLNEFKNESEHPMYWVANYVRKVYGVSLENLKSKSRDREYVVPRQISMFFIKEFHRPLSLKSIGKFLGGRDHSTVIHALKTVSDLTDSDNQFKEKIKRIRAGLKKLQGKDEPKPVKISKQLQENIETLQLMSL
jgi:chromosomal replication initiator protein